jgi:endonuclease-8
MPEGDILRRTAVTLNRALRGAVLLGAELRWPDAGSVDLTGRTVLGTEAYGKHLFTRFDDGRTLHTHLRMEGTWRVARTRREGSTPTNPDIRAVLTASQWTATGHRLGMLDVVPTREERNLIAHLGPDVLADDFPVLGLPQALDRFAAQRDTPVAEVLLDQRVVAGLGTVFMAESLFTRRLWPWTPADRVSDPASLLMTARLLMERSVKAQLPTATGEIGRNRTTRVHGRLRQPCPRCGTPIAVGQARRPPFERPVFYCPTCQVVGRPVSRRA